MEKINAVIMALAGFGLLYLGNTLSEQGGLLDSIGVGIAITGDLIIFYAIYRGIKWIWKKIRK